MRNGWEIKTLREVCEIKPPKAEARQRLRDDDLVSFLPMEDLGIGEQNVIAIKERKLKDVAGSYTYFADNDVLLAKITPCFENGKLGIARKLKNGVGFGSSEYVVFRLNEQLIPEYLFYFLSQQAFRTEGKNRMSGAVGHKRVSKEFIENTEIPVPPLDEQKRIVAILDEAFEAIDKAKQNAEKNLQNARELFESYFQNIFANPGDDWETVRLDEITNIVSGFSFKSTDFSPANELKSIKITNVGVREFVEEDENLLPQRFNDTYRNYKIRADNIVVALTRTIIAAGLKVAIVPAAYEGALLNQRVAAIAPINSKINGSLLYRYLCTKHVANYVLSKVNTLMQPNLSINDLKRMPVPLPNRSDQKKLAGTLNHLSEMTERLESVYWSKRVALDELKNSILQKAFSGEL